MSQRLHCDAPDCERTSFLSDPEWWLVERVGEDAGIKFSYHFCSKRCLAAWATPSRERSADAERKAHP